ncbi:MAG: protein kinase [Wenzhouxiangella sp.]|nr:protein kinase [Wenzhouxiangella sp.]
MNADKQEATEQMARLLELAESQQELELSAIAGSDPALARTVATLLHHARPQTGRARPDQPGDMTGRRLGPWMLVRGIGSGGMGDVFLAERADRRFSGQAAIKMLRSGPGSETLLERFHSEGSILAQLDHPGIARLLDAGSSDEGWPYLVMEYVDGEPIDRFCERHQPGIDQRLQLFLQVCDAVQHAHRAFVIHRDLKPGNILVNRNGQVKLLDFGIAKLLERRGDLEQSSELALTPAYAAPEPVLGQATTATTDVHALGLLLHELLTDERAFGASGQRTSEVIQQIVHDLPPSPSQIATRQGNSGLARRLRGNLDAIVLKALAKQPDERYLSVEQLATDIRRHLSHLPVNARSAGIVYRTACLIRRQPLAILLTVLVAAAVLGSLTVVWQQARIASEERRLAEQRFNQVRELAGALIFEIHDSIEPLPGSMPARQTIVSRAIDYLQGLARDAVDDTGLLIEMAGAYDRVGTLQGHPARSNLGDLRGALDSYREALALRQSALQQVTAGSDLERKIKGDIAHSHDLKGDLLGWMGQADEARAQFLEAYQIRRELAAESPNDLSLIRAVAVSEFKLGEHARANGAPGQAREHFGRAVSAFRRLHHFDPDNARELETLAITLQALGDLEGRINPDQALVHFREGYDLAERRLELTPDSFAARRGHMISLSRIGSALDWLERHEQAIPVHEQVASLTRQLLDEDPDNRMVQRDMAVADNKLAASYQALGRTVPAAQSKSRAITQLRNLADGDSGNVQLNLELIRSLVEAAELALNASLADQARTFVAEALERLDDPDTAGSSNAPLLRLLATQLRTRIDSVE